MKYNVVYTYGGTYGSGAVYKIYLSEKIGDSWVVNKPIAGRYFSLRKGEGLDEDTNFDTYKEAVDFVFKDCIEQAFSKVGLHPSYKKMIKDIRSKL